jgi:hypothetical protein
MDKDFSSVSWSTQSYLALVDVLNQGSGFRRIADEVEALDESSIPALEDFLRRYQNVLHPNHYHCLGVLHSLCQLYGKAPGYLINDMTEEQLRHKRDLCRQLLKVVDVLEPGYSRLRGEHSHKHEKCLPDCVRVTVIRIAQPPQQQSVVPRAATRGALRVFFFNLVLFAICTSTFSELCVNEYSGL